MSILRFIIIIKNGIQLVFAVMPWKRVAIIQRQVLSAPNWAFSEPALLLFRSTTQKVKEFSCTICLIQLNVVPLMPSGIKTGTSCVSMCVRVTQCMISHGFKTRLSLASMKILEIESVDE